MLSVVSPYSAMMPDSLNWGIDGHLSGINPLSPTSLGAWKKRKKVNGDVILSYNLQKNISKILITTKNVCVWYRMSAVPARMSINLGGDIQKTKFWQ